MKKLLSVFMTGVLLACPLASCEKKEEKKGEITEGYTNNQPFFDHNKGELNHDEQVTEDLNIIFNNYFIGTNKSNPDLELTAYTPTAYVDKLKEIKEYENYLLKIDTQITHEKMYWNEYGDNAQLTFDGIQKVYTLNEAFNEKAENYIKEEFSVVDFDFEVEAVCEVYFRYTLSGSNGSDTSDSTVCAAKIKDDGWKLIFDSSSGLANG